MVRSSRASCWRKASSDGSGTSWPAVDRTRGRCTVMCRPANGTSAAMVPQWLAVRVRRRLPLAPAIRSASARSTSPRTSNPRHSTHEVRVSRALATTPVTSGRSNWSICFARPRFLPCLTACFGVLLRMAAPCP